MHRGLNAIAYNRRTHVPHRIDPRGWLVPRTAFLAVLFIYLIVVRTRGVADTFALRGDQMRDWTWALAPLRELRMTGTPSHVGGTTLGPVYYWTLWTIRHLIGPWTDNLPHAGGIGLSIVQAAADVLLLVAIWKKTASWWLALAVVLFVATAPFDMAISAAMWNPALSEALVKTAIAFVLLAGDHPSAWRVAGITAAAWLAVQAHSIAIFVAAPILVSLVVSEIAGRHWRTAFDRLRLIVEVIVILQIPFFVDLLRHPPDIVAPTAVVNSLAYTLGHPASVRLGQTIDAVCGAFAYVLIRPWSLAPFKWLLLIVTAAAAMRVRRDLMLASVTVLPLAAFVVGFSLTQLPFDSYYALPLGPSLGLTVGLALTLWQPAARPLAVAATVALLLAQPGRYGEARTGLPVPFYGALVKGSREIRRWAPDIRSIETDFALPESTDPAFIYQVLGGRLLPDSRFTARIGLDGGVTFTATAP